MKSYQKMFFIFFMFIIFNIPFIFISGLINERQDLYNSTVENIGKEWGEKQEILGPFLTIEYDQIVDKNVEKKELVVFPENLISKIELKTENRNRGIYDATVYTANLNAKGYFSYEKIENYLSKNNIKPNKIFLSFSISNQSRIENVKKFIVYSENVKSNLESTTNYSYLNSGLSYPMELKEGKIDYEIDLSFRGSIGINVVPIAEENKIQISSNWSSPSFYSILPSNKNIGTKGFDSSWEVSGLIRSYPQFNIDGIKNDFQDEDYEVENIQKNIISVKLFDSVNSYTQVLRATKYGILFVVLTLSVVYIFDVMGRKKTHIIQYGVVGASLAMFYLLLLSISEHLGFTTAYLISTLAIVVPNSLYIYSITNNKKFALGLFAFLVGIYAVLYSILNMEQYALLAGTLLVLVVLYSVMYITRKIENFVEI